MPGAPVPSDSSLEPSSELSASQPAATVRTAYLPQLDGLRALAILMVFAHHAFGVPLLWSGVDLFFLLSGFLITNILLRDSGRMSFRRMLGQFYLRRAQRILPAYLLCLAVIALFVPQPWRLLWPFYAFFLQNVPFAFGWMEFGPLVPLWSLAVEQHFYLFWPFLVYFLPRRALPWTLVGLLLGIPVLRALCTPLFSSPQPIYSLTPFRIDAMAAGALCALWLPRWSVPAARKAALLAMALGLVLYGLLAGHPWFHRGGNTWQFNSLAYSLNILVLGGLFVLTVLASPAGVLMRLLSNTPMRFLGRVSYSFYLLHLLALFLADRYLHSLTAAAAAFAATLAAATLSWYALERPILALGGDHRGAALKTGSS